MTERNTIREVVDDRLTALPGILDMTLTDYFADCVLDGPEMEMLEKYRHLTVDQYLLLWSNTRNASFYTLADVEREPCNELELLYGLYCEALPGPEFVFVVRL